jgi:hypothetical protein
VKNLLGLSNSVQALTNPKASPVILEPCHPDEGKQVADGLSAMHELANESFRPLDRSVLQLLLERSDEPLAGKTWSQ